MRKITLLRSDPWLADPGGWVLRTGVAAFFVLTGLDKFPSGPGTHWPQLFAQIGFGQWFRYFTGVVEVTGGVLYLFPPTCVIGAALLACTMAGAVLVHIVLGHGALAIIPALLLFAVMSIASRRPDEPLGSRRGRASGGA